MPTSRTHSSALEILWLALIAVLLAALTYGAGHLIACGMRPIVIVVSLMLGGCATVTVIAVIFSALPRNRSARLRAFEMQAFCNAIRRAANTLELQDIIDEAARIVVEIGGVKGCSIKLLDNQAGRMEARSVVGIEREHVVAAIEVADRLYQKRMMRGEPILVKDVRMRDFPAVDDEFESMVCVPLQLEDRVLGAICVFGEPGQRLPDSMISILATLADVIALAVGHATIYEELKRLVDTKTKFMFQASHELRSPLDSIRSMAHTILEGYLGDLTEKQRQMLFRMDLRAATASDIVGDLLVLARGRAELTTLKPDRVDLADLIDQACELLGDRAGEKGVSLESSASVAGCIAMGNEEGLRSAITNLTANAVKYTPAGGRVSVRLSLEDEMALLEVVDTGIGIPTDEVERVFSEFFRASNAQSVEETGTGLGLAIVKATVEQHGGSVTLRSEVGVGTTVTLRLPVLTEASGDPSPVA